MVPVLTGLPGQHGASRSDGTILTRTPMSSSVMRPHLAPGRSRRSRTIPCQASRADSTRTLFPSSQRARSWDRGDPASFVRRRKHDYEICRWATRYNSHRHPLGAANKPQTTGRRGRSPKNSVTSGCRHTRRQAEASKADPRRTVKKDAPHVVNGCSDWGRSWKS